MPPGGATRIVAQREQPMVTSSRAGRASSISSRGGRGKLKVGVIGCGHIATMAHLPNIRQLSGVRLVAVADARAEAARRVGEEYGVAWYGGDNAVSGMLKSR